MTECSVQGMTAKLRQAATESASGLFLSACEVQSKHRERVCCGEKDGYSQTLQSTVAGGDRLSDFVFVFVPVPGVLAVLMVSFSSTEYRG